MPSRLAAASLAAILLASGAARAESFGSCLGTLRSAALSKGVSAATFDRATRGLEPDMKVIELMDNQPEFKTPIWDYLATLTDEEKVAEGQTMLRRHAATLAEAERRHLWTGSWLLAGVESDVAASGDYLLFEQLGRSVIVVRGKDGAVRAFHNVCRHRASALVSNAKGRAAKIVCPYHAWTYNLDGSLAGVPDARDFACLDKSQRGLLPVTCSVWRGLIFINFDPDARPLSEFTAALDVFTSGFQLEGLVVQDFVDMDCNWKLAYHNFIESYHVNSVHPGSLGPFLELKTRVVTLGDQGHARMALGKAKGSSIYAVDVEVPDGTDPIFRTHAISLAVFPNTFFVLDPSGLALQSFWPDGNGRSKLEVRIAGWAPRAENPDYWDSLRTVVDDIVAEDLRLFAGLQRGVQSGALESIVTNFQERTIYWFEEEMDRRIGADHIPPGMSVVPVLAGFADSPRSASEAAARLEPQAEAPA